MTDTRTWGVVDLHIIGLHEWHLLPLLNGIPLTTHDYRSCPCFPTVVRDRPLDEPTYDHHEPGWPGEDRKLS